MGLSDSCKQQIIKEIESYYKDEEKFKSIFTSNQGIFGPNFYGSVRGNDFNTRIINLVEELEKTELLEKFIKIIKEEYYPGFCGLLDISSEIALDGLIKILDPDFNNDKVRETLLKVYQEARPNRQIGNFKLPKNATELINGLNIPSGEGKIYSYLEKFVITLVENYFDLPVSLKEDLRLWVEKHIGENYETERKAIEQEKREKEKKCNPCLFVAISSERQNYFVEAWLTKNIRKYNREYSADCVPLDLDNQKEIPTNKKLTNLPELIQKFIKESFDKCKKKNLKHIHVFLPSDLINHDLNCCYSWEEDEDDNQEATSPNLDKMPGMISFISQILKPLVDKVPRLKLRSNQDEHEKQTIMEEYEVIIRFSERLRGKDKWISNWYDKAKILQDKLKVPANKVLISSDDKSEYKTFYLRLKNDDTLNGVRFTDIVPEKKYHKILLRSGIPLALWIRQQLSGVNIAQELNKLLKKDNGDILLEELPYKVKKKRGTGAEVSKHICLLWDDPNLLPPKQLLTPINNK